AEHLVDRVGGAAAALAQVADRDGGAGDGRRRRGGRWCRTGQGAGGRDQSLGLEALEQGRHVRQAGQPGQLVGRAVPVDQDQQPPLADVQAGLALPDLLLAGRRLRVHGVPVHVPPERTVPFATNLATGCILVQRVFLFPPRPVSFPLA